MREKAIDYRV